MLHNDVAQQRPGEKPASAPKTSQNSPRVQGQARFKIPTLKHAHSRHEAIDAAGLKDGNMETSHIIPIRGRHSLQRRVPPTTLATTQRVQHPHSPTILWQEHMLLPQHARHHPFGEGHVQARSVLDLWSQHSCPDMKPRTCSNTRSAVHMHKI